MCTAQQIDGDGFRFGTPVHCSKALAFLAGSGILTMVAWQRTRLGWKEVKS